MTATPPLPLGRLGADAFGTASGLALVTGALSLLLPSLRFPTATLAALAVAGWASVRRRPARDGPGRAHLGAGRLSSLGLLAVAAAAFLDPPAALQPLRGLLLALALVPLWWLERGAPGRPRRPGARR